MRDDPSTELTVAFFVLHVFRMTVFFLPRLAESFTSLTPVAFLDLREKSGALVPTAMGIVFFEFWVEQQTGGHIRPGCGGVKPRFRFLLLVILILILLHPAVLNREQDQD